MQPFSVSLFILYSYDSSAARKDKNPDVNQTSLFTSSASSSGVKYQRKDGISDFILGKAKTQYQITDITKEDIFYYVYGILHSPVYRETFSADLKKMLPRIPLVPSYDDFCAFSQAGRELADLHLHYETVEPYAACCCNRTDAGNFRVTKMRFPQKGQKDTILYNAEISVSSIPERAYGYTLGGVSAIEWIMERYQVTIDKDSGIKNDPNDWTEASGNPRYILDLLLSVITVSMKTMEIVESLPRFEC